MDEIEFLDKVPINYLSLLVFFIFFLFIFQKDSGCFVKFRVYYIK